MSPENNGDVTTHPFSVLTSDRLTAFCKAIHEANQAFTQFAIQQARSFSGMDNTDLSCVLRGFIKSSLKRALGGDVNIRVRKDNGVFLIAIDQYVLIHLKKLNKRTLTGSIPKTLLGAKSEPRQEPLPGFEDDLDDNIPLGNFEHQLVAGYVTDISGTVSDFYFNVQEGSTLLDQLKLDMSSPIIRIEGSETQQPSGTVFTLKKNNVDTDQKAVGNA